jgi:hypothetical protein
MPVSGSIEATSAKVLRVYALAAIVLLCLTLPANTVSAQPADTVLFNGKILTVDRDFSVQQALAIGHGEVTSSRPPSRDP